MPPHVVVVDGKGAIFFYKACKPSVSPYGCLSNFAYGEFTVVEENELPPEVAERLRDVVFSTAEHAIMAIKALIMGDESSFERIRAAKTPLDAKALGRKIAPFDEDLWCRLRPSVASVVVRSKFSQIDAFGQVLRSTRTAGPEGTAAVIAEASPRDAIWGIGMSKATAVKVARKNGRFKWSGQNLLGATLYQIAREL
jgi:hypothetical protein